MRCVEADYPERYQKRLCNEIMKLSLQGHSILTASGDYGVSNPSKESEQHLERMLTFSCSCVQVASFPGDITDSGCISAAGQNQTIYNPDALSSCPWITSVGATQLYDNQTVLDRESVMQDNLGVGRELFASTGGFSNYFGTPDYQKAAVSEYLTKYEPGHPYYVADANATNIGANGGIYNRGGRGFPDVSANGAHLGAYRNGTLRHFYGTSLSSPLFASVLTLINEERTAVGKGPVGFVNAVLYASKSHAALRS